MEIAQACNKSRYHSVISPVSVRARLHTTICMCVCVCAVCICVDACNVYVREKTSRDSGSSVTHRA